MIADSIIDITKTNMYQILSYIHLERYIKPRQNLEYWIVMTGCFYPKYSDVTVVVITNEVSVVVITTAQLYSAKPAELRFCAASSPTCGVSEVRDAEQLSFIVKHNHSVSLFRIKGYASGLWVIDLIFF